MRLESLIDGGDKMKILIEIPEHIYEHAKETTEDTIDETKAMCAIANGLPITDGGICDLCKNQDLGTLAVCFHCTATLKAEDSI